MEIKKLSLEQTEKLKAPLPNEAIKQHPTKTFLSTIKAIYVVERLNDVFGIGSWHLRSEIVDNKSAMIVVRTTLSVPEYGIDLESFGGNDNGGENSKNHDLGDAYKGATTDALTKICSYLEIGMDVFKGKQTSATVQPKKEQPVTSYNHNAIQQGNKPLITNAAFKKALDRIKAGEVEVYEKILAAFSLEATQKSMLETAYAEAKTKLETNKSA